MKRQELLKQMKESIGTKEPIEFFDNMVEVFNILLDKIDSLESNLNRVKTHSALAIQWEPRVANDMLVKQIAILREDKESYHDELTKLKKASVENIVTLDYNTFCNFWMDTLGWHPFLD